MHKPGENPAEDNHSVLNYTKRPSYDHPSIPFPVGRVSLGYNMDAGSAFWILFKENKKTKKLENYVLFNLAIESIPLHAPFNPNRADVRTTRHL